MQTSETLILGPVLTDAGQITPSSFPHPKNFETHLDWLAMFLICTLQSMFYLLASYLPQREHLPALSGYSSSTYGHFPFNFVHRSKR